jgi:hypothetical protein
MAGVARVAIGVAPTHSADVPGPFPVPPLFPKIHKCEIW